MNCYAHIEELTHGNKKKVDRVTWALQGNFEHGRILLNTDGDFDLFVDELLMFPTQGVHDDTVDALAYVHQLVRPSFDADDGGDEWETLDVISGY